MYCPECGTDAAEANYCPECGNDLTTLAEGARERAGVCPECGTDAGKARFCPECGHQMAAAGGRTPRPGRSTAGQPKQHQRPRAARRAAERREPPKQAPSRRPVALIWGGFALVALVVVVVVAIAAGGGDAPSAGSEAVAADTSGSYSELVGRANDLYDQGIAAFNDNDSSAGEQKFRAAAEVYKAAWKQQPGDPNVGTDFAVSLFYSRHHDEALRQVDLVLKGTPDFQPAYLNKGIFLKTESAEAKESGETAKAAKSLSQAKLAFEKAVSIDRNSETGRRAAELLKSL